MKENQHIEWKESWRDEYLRWVCGFANAEGGVLVIGRTDKGLPVGVKGAAKLLEDIPNKVRDVLGIMVDVNLVAEGGFELIEIHVAAYPNPVSYKGEYHYRSGSTKQELKGAALARFLLRKQGLHWDGVPLPNFALADCSSKAMQFFRTKAARSGRLDEAVLADSENALLTNLGLYEGSLLRRAAGLLFGEKFENHVPGSYIKIGFFVTNDDLRYQDEVHGDLFSQVENTLEILKSKYLKAYISYEGLQRVETYLFPMQGLREALLNAVIHKDYSTGVPIQLSVYDHQIVLWNPGQLPQEWSLEKFLGKHPSDPYNPLVAAAFFRAGYVESWGRGIEKILRECVTHDVPVPVFDTSMSGLMITFNANPAHLVAAVGSVAAERLLKGDRDSFRVVDRGTIQETTQETTQETISKLSQNYPKNTQENLLALLRGQPDMTIAELAIQLKITPIGVRYHLAKLKDAGTIQRVGSSRSGYWKVSHE
jgi:ATP-dependent DNA helicase RecG